MRVCDCKQNNSTMEGNIGGLYAYSSDEGGSTSLDSAIRRLWSDLAVCKQSTPVEIQRTSLEMSLGHMTYRGSVHVDRTVGEDTEFVFTLPRSADIEIRVKSPIGREYDSSYSNYTHDEILNIIRVRVQVDLNSTGTWTYTLRQSSFKLYTVGITVTSKPRNKKSTFQFRAWMNNITMLTSLSSRPTVYAHVHKGYSPVIHADVSVSLEQPTGSVSVVHLRDDGKDPDNVKDDGVYTAWVVSFSSSSQYTLDALVRAVPGRTLVVIRGDVAASRAWGKYRRSQGARAAEPVGELFTRTHSPGMVSWSYFTPHLHRLPPPRVTDLTVRVTDRGVREVTLWWTVPRHSKATSCDIRVGFSFMSVKEMFHEALPADESFALHELPSLAAGDTHEVTMLIPVSLKQSTFVFGMKTTDGDDLTSELSNLVAVTFEPTSGIEIPGTQSNQSASSTPGLSSLASLAGLLCAALFGAVFLGVARSRSTRNKTKDVASDLDLEC